MKLQNYKNVLLANQVRNFTRQFSILYTEQINYIGMREDPTGDHHTVSELDCCVNVESFSITYLTEVLPQQQAKYSSRQGDKCPPTTPPLPHSSWRWWRQLSSASSPKFALTLGITDPYLVLCCLKRLNTAHGVPDSLHHPPPLPSPHTHTQTRARTFRDCT